MVLVRSETDPYGVELGSNVRPALTIAMLEMALLKLKKGLG